MILLYPSCCPLLLSWRKKERNETKPAGVTEEPGEKYSQVLTSVPKIKAEFFLTLQILEGRKYGKLLLGNSHVSLRHSELSMPTGTTCTACASPIFCHGSVQRKVQLPPQSCVPSSLLWLFLVPFAPPAKSPGTLQGLGLASGHCILPLLAEQRENFQLLSCSLIAEVGSFRFKSNMHGLVPVVFVVALLIAGEVCKSRPRIFKKKRKKRKTQQQQRKSVQLRA